MAGSSHSRQHEAAIGGAYKPLHYFEKAWAVFLAKRTDADFQEGRNQQEWTAEKYRRFDCGERMPPD